MGSEAGQKTCTWPCRSIKETSSDLEPIQEKFIVTRHEVLRFVKEVFLTLGAPPENAQQLAESISNADYKGHYSHGMNRLGLYISDIRHGTMDLKATPSILAESSATAWVDGNNALGVVVGNFCMQLAIKKAKEAGVGWVVAKGSNHIGIVHWFPEQAMKEGLLGFACSNTSPVTVPWGAKNPALGTNPISFAAPGENNDSFIMDISTSAVSKGKIEFHAKENEPIPPGWAIDSDGKYITDAKVACEKGALTPLGGDRNGHKGYCLSVMVEAMSGILAGSKFGPHVRKWGKEMKRADLGQCYACINPEFFAPGYKERMSSFMDYLRNMDPRSCTGNSTNYIAEGRIADFLGLAILRGEDDAFAVDPKKPVQVPGDWERNNKKIHEEQGGLSYTPIQMKWANDLAKELGIAPLKFK